MTIPKLGRLKRVDLRTAWKREDTGFTQDTQVNLMLREQRDDEKQVRIDRILLGSLSESWRPDAIELLGTEPVSPDSPSVFPSDHFGLLGRIRHGDV